MSFLKKLFGGGAGRPEAAATPARTLDYKGYVIRATPFRERDRYQVCGVIGREVDGVMKEQTFIRADASPSLDDAIEMTFFKGRQIIDHGGGDLPA